MHRLLFAAALLLDACAPLTAYRYAAFTPTARPIAWDGAVPERGEVQVEGSLAHTDVLPQFFPAEHAAALNLAATTAEGLVSVGLVRGLGLGLRATYANWAWSQPSAAGTMPLPGKPSMWGIGPELKVAFTIDPEQRFSLGFAANALLYQLPWAEWKAGDCSAFTCGYAPSRTGTDAKLVFAGGFYPSYALGEGGKFGQVFAMLAFHTDFKNDGFTNDKSANSTLQTDGLVPLAGGGASVRLGPVKLGGTVYLPLSSQGSSGAQRLGGMVTVGYDGK